MRLQTTLLVLIAVVFGSANTFAQQVLLIPDSDGDVIGTYDAFDGSLINPNFIVSAGELLTPINAIDSGNQTIYVSDQLADSIFEYDFDGNFLGVAFDVNDGIDNVRGIEVVNGELFASIGSGTFADTILRIDANGVASPFITGPDSFDFLFRGFDVLVNDISDEDIDSFNPAGAFNFQFHDSDGVGGIDFPGQMHLASNSDVIVAGQLPPRGVYRYDSSGTEVAFFSTVDDAVRGVYELGNGDILYTLNGRVRTLDPTTGVSTTVATGGNYRFIDPIDFELVEQDCTIASNLTVFRGLQLSGNLADSFGSDDLTLNFNPGFVINSDEAPVWLILEGTLDNLPGMLEIVVESNAGTPGLTLTTEAFDFSTNGYTVVDERNESFNNDSIATINITSGLTNFVDSNLDVQMRIGWRRTGFSINFPWEVRLDQAVWKTN